MIRDPAVLDLAVVVRRRGGVVDRECRYVRQRTDDVGNPAHSRRLSGDRHTRLGEAEARGQGWSRTAHPNESAVVSLEWERTVESALGFDREFRILRENGKVQRVRALSRPVDGDGGKVRNHVGSVEDITREVRRRQALESTYERMILATEYGRIGIWDWNVRGGTLDWTPQMYKLFGLPRGPERVALGLWADRVHPEDRRALQRAVRAALAGENDLDAEFRVVHDDGSVHHLCLAARLTHDTGGETLRMLGTSWNVTPLRVLSGRLAEQHELLHVTLQSIGDAVITTDATGHVTWLNPVAEHLCGWPSVEAAGRPLSQVFDTVHEETRQPGIDPVATCLASGIKASLASGTVLISRTGNEFGIEDSTAPIRGAGGELLGAVLVFHDVSEQRRLSGEMSYRATHDALTGLVNRAEFELRLEHALTRAHEERCEHALLYIDLDQFKLVNDACGHSVGDELLWQVADLMGGVVRSHDTLARIGGDEFAAILEDCSSAQAQRVAQTICERMDHLRFVHDGRRFHIGASIGLVPIDVRWAGTAAAMQAADASCYAAKEAGRNRVHVWFDTDQGMRERERETQWAARLEQALDEGRFALYAQRIGSMAGNAEGLHAEVLIRLRDEDGRLILPEAFLPAAERFHLATRIDRWVLRRVIELVEALPERSAVQTLCINLSGQSVGDRAFHRDAVAVLERAGVEVCRRLCLEITETAAITNMNDAIAFAEQVRALGVGVALDDFGAGASSFGYLRSLPVDVLKIDGLYIRNMIDDALDDVAVRCFVDVARVTGVKTVAEHVDRPELLERVRTIGIDYVQGFLLHEPEPIENVLRSAGAAAL